MCIALVLFGCGSVQQSTKEPEAPQREDDISDVKTQQKLPKGQISREKLMREMSPGMGAFLQRLQVQSVMRGGEFYGFRIIELKGTDGFWNDVDLLPGDVITSVNEQPIGHYEQAIRVWNSLVLADSIRVAYDRKDKPRVLRYEIRDSGLK